MSIRVGIVGCLGRMGQALAREVHGAEGCALAGGTEAAGHAGLGTDLGEAAGLGRLGLPVGGDATALFRACDVVLDFTAPAATVAHAGIAAAERKALIAGTTGLSPEQEERIKAAAASAAIVRAANFSLGVNLLLAITERVAALLDPAYDIEIVEMHHRHKVDAPSGTALALGHAAAQGRGVRLADVAERGRDGVTGARARGAIGFAALRGGDVAGEHTVVFAADGERVELTHKAGTRQIFARGAVRAALWVAGKPPGLYSMADVLGL